MKQICPWAKLIVMLRDPVKRAFSHYQMSIDMSGTPEQVKVRGQSAYQGKSFRQIIDEEILELKRLGINHECTAEDFQARFLLGLPMNHGGHSLVARGLYALQLELWIRNWPAEQLRVFSLYDIKGSKPHVQKTMDIVFDYLGLPESDVADVSPKNTRQYDEMPEDCRQILNDFYEPFNHRLWTLLQRQLEW